MMKRIAIALAGLFAILGFAAAPSSGTPAAVGDVTLYEEKQFDTEGAVEVVDEADIPTNCSPIPVTLTTLRSFENNTSGLGTTVAVFADSDSTCSADRLATIDPGKSNPDIQDPANSTQGAGHWMAVSS